MKKLLTVFSIMIIVSCGIAYGGNSNENTIGISELAGRSYNTIMLPLPMPFIFSFDESGNFILLPLKDFAESYSGYYTQTGYTFTAHCEYESGIYSGEFNFKGASILDIFICGICTGRPTDGDEEFIAVFFGILKLFNTEVE